MVESDAAYIVDLRSRAGRHLNRGATSVEQQAVWLERYFERPGDFYFVVEGGDGARPEGLVALYGITYAAGTGEWGRFVLEPASNAAVESALLVYRFAFDMLALETVCCRTLAANESVVAFHDSCGMTRARGAVTIEHNGAHAAAIEHRMARTQWPAVRERLDQVARRFARNRRPARRVNTP